MPFPKLDFKKVDKSFYTGKPGRFDLIEMPPLAFLKIDGSGNPNTSPDYLHAVAALYVVSYQLKAFSKTQLGRDYTVGPLEGLWWADDMDTFVTRQKDSWKWTMMIRQPDWVGEAEIETAQANAIAKQAKLKEPRAQAETLQALRFVTHDEGLCVQTLHVGSYDDEGPVLDQMHNSFIPDNGLAMPGLHHEIYLSDPRKVATEKLKTILRQPVTRV